MGFYDSFAVEEYYVYDQPGNLLEVWLRQDGHLRRMAHIKGWTSRRLGILFALTGDSLAIFDPQGQPFLSSAELAERLRQEAARAEQERARAERLADRLCALGIEP